MNILYAWSSFWFQKQKHSIQWDFGNVKTIWKTNIIWFQRLVTKDSITAWQLNIYGLAPFHMFSFCQSIATCNCTIKYQQTEFWQKYKIGKTLGLLATFHCDDWALVSRSHPGLVSSYGFKEFRITVGTLQHVLSIVTMDLFLLKRKQLWLKFYEHCVHAQIGHYSCVYRTVRVLLITLSFSISWNVSQQFSIIKLCTLLIAYGLLFVANLLVQWSVFPQCRFQKSA